MSRFYDDGFDWRKGPEPGDGATQPSGSDSYPHTVVNVSSERVKFMKEDPDDRSLTEEVSWPKWIEVVDDSYKAISGSAQNGSAEYVYETRLDSSPERYILKNGVYRRATQKYDPETRTYSMLNSCKNDAPRMNVGYRKYYYDPHK